MDDTENYLNSILKKRLGSVVNYNGSSKTANTVTRIPKQEEKVENMPTVFRKKHETVYLQQGQQNIGSYYSEAQSEYLSMKEPSLRNHEKFFKEDQEMMPEDNNNKSASQRVEYMLISKRIQNLKEDEPIMPTVDVTNYRMGTIANNKQIITKNQHGTNDYYHNEANREENYSDLHQNNEFNSRMSSNTNQTKRKRIFGGGVQ